MRKQLRSSDVLFKAKGITNNIKNIEDITVDAREDVVTEHWLCTAFFSNHQSFSYRVRTSEEYFVKELRQFVKEVNRQLRNIANECSSKT